MNEPVTDLLLPVQLPLSLWRILIVHLQAGPFADVGNSLSEMIHRQLQSQIAEVCAVEERRLIEEARKVAEAANAAQVPHAEAAEPGTAKGLH